MTLRAPQGAVRSAVLYRFTDVDGRLLYIGVTAIGPARWISHAAHQPWWPLVANVSVEHFSSESEAFIAEESAIKAEHPAFNVIYNVPRSAPTRRTRPRGSGSIYQRQDGRWVAQISLGWRGYGRRPARYCATREQAEAALLDLQAEAVEV